MSDQTSTPDFATYDLSAMPTTGVYGLASGLLLTMAHSLNYDLGGRSTADALDGFIKHVGPNKYLQENIALVQELMKTTSDANTIAANWVTASGCLQPLDRSFVHPGMQTPKHIDVAVISGAVPRWMTRRADRLVKHVKAGNSVGRVILVGSVPDGKPDEAKFLEDEVKPKLEEIELDVSVVPVPNGKGSDVMAAAVTEAGLDGISTILMVGNAPAGTMSAGQFRKACRASKSEFDKDGDQLFVIADDIEVARHGEGPEKHQNPFTALGQILRNAVQLDNEHRAYLAQH